MTNIADQRTYAAPGLLTPASVLVAIPTLNEAGHIESCLESLIGADPFMQDVLVVVADGGSRDSTVMILKRLSNLYPQLRVIANPRRLQAAAINAVVAREASPEHRYLVRCDAHSDYPSGYVRSVVQSLVARPEAAAVGSVLDAVGEGCFQRAAAWVCTTPLGTGGSAHRSGKVSGWVDHAHHAAFRLRWFRMVGGYDESFSHNEDAELDYRLGQAGGRVWLDADVRQNYHMRETLWALGRQYWNYGQGRAKNVSKHHMSMRPRQLVPVFAVLTLMLSLISGFFWYPALLPFAFYLALMGGVSIAAVAALRGPCGVWAGPAMAMIHLAWGLGFLAHFCGYRR